MFNKLFGKSDKKNNSPELESIYTIIRSLLDKDLAKVELTPDSNLEELGFNSIKYIHLLLSLEDVIKMDLEKIVAETDLTEIKTIRDISNLVTNLNKTGV